MRTCLGSHGKVVRAILPPLSPTVAQGVQGSGMEGLGEILAKSPRVPGVRWLEQPWPVPHEASALTTGLSVFPCQRSHLHGLLQLGAVPEAPRR